MTATKKYIKKRRYIKPGIKVTKIKVNLFSDPNLLDYSELAICFGCIGDTCPPGCSRSCFLAGTNIRTTIGDKNINEIKKGNKVFSYDLTENKLTISEIRKVLVHRDISPYLIINKNINVTPEHRFWVNNKSWKRAINIRIGDFLLNSNSRKVIVTSIELLNKKVSVYNLSLNGRYHNYFAEDVLVHNWK